MSLILKTCQDFSVKISLISLHGQRHDSIFCNNVALNRGLRQKGAGTERAHNVICPGSRGLNVKCMSFLCAKVDAFGRERTKQPFISPKLPDYCCSRWGCCRKRLRNYYLEMSRIACIFDVVDIMRIINELQGFTVYPSWVNVKIECEL